MRVAIYVRVSTVNQVHDQTIEQQLSRLQEHAEQQGWSLPSESIFRDDGYSGASLKRPALDRLRDKVHYREFDCLLVTAPDRLARNYVHQMLLIEELEQHGCQVQFLDRPMSTDPHDQLLLQIRGAVAEYERTLIAERMRRGRLTKLQAGVLLPWTHPPYGYVLHPDRPRDPSGVSIEPTQAAIVAELFATYLQDDASLWTLVCLLRQRQLPSPNGKPCWGIATLRGILTNPVYAGQIYVGRSQYRPARIRRSATHPIGRPHDSSVPVPPSEWKLIAEVPAIVSQEQFELVQAKLEQNKKLARRNNKSHQYLLRALVSCGRCQYACIARTQSAYHYYVCSNKGDERRRRGAESCTAGLIPSEQLDELVWQDLCRILREPEQITAAMERARGGEWMPQEWRARQENVRAAQASLNRQLERLTEAYLQGIIPLAEYQRRRGETDQKAQSLLQQEQQMKQQAAQQQEIAGLAAGATEFCERMCAALAGASFEQQRRLVELLIDRVIVNDDEIEIRYVIPTGPAGEHTRFCHLRTDYFHAPNMVGRARAHSP